MRSAWLQVMLFFVYAALLFFVSRIIDLVVWYRHGVHSTQLVDPLLLSVCQLKQLLENRGVSYTGYVEKKELAQLAEESAPIVHGEIQALSQNQNSQRCNGSCRERLQIPPTSSYFSGGAHFYEEVEDTKDSVWLVQVVPAGNKNEPLLDDYSWRVVCNHVAPFAIRTGVFDCSLDKRLCITKGWQSPLLLLALPKGTRAKDKVILKIFTSTKPQAIIDWVRDQLSIRVKTIESYEELEQKWLSENVTKSTPGGWKPHVKVLFLSNLLHPPLFLAALSIKFTGRIKFGMFSVKKHESDLLRKFKKIDVKVPGYVIVTPEQKFAYGKRKFEHFNFDSMHRFLQAVQPEMNDVFLLSLSFINLLVILQIFQVSVHRSWKYIARCVWTLICYNFWLFVTWLTILALCKFSVMNLVTENILVLVRMISLSDFGSLVRSDWQSLQHYPSSLFVSFLLFGFLSAWLLCLYFPEETVYSSESNCPWWEVLPVDSFLINCLFRPMTSLSRPLPSTDLELEEGIEMLIERLAVPNLWLHPVISNEYVKGLPIWKFRGWDLKDTDRRNVKEISCDSPEAVQRLMDYEHSLSGPNKKYFEICKLCLKERLKIKHSNACYKKLPQTTFEMTSCHKGNGSPFCTNKPRSTSKIHERQQQKKSSHSTCSLPIEVKEFCNCKVLRQEKINCFPFCDKSDGEQENKLSDSGDEANSVPAGMLPVSECAVCLEAYAWGSLLCGLPCGHSYHQSCIMLWLHGDNHHCPVCRWPAYKSKIRSAQSHKE